MKRFIPSIFFILIFQTSLGTIGCSGQFGRCELLPDPDLSAYWQPVTQYAPPYDDWMSGKLMVVRQNVPAHLFRCRPAQAMIWACEDITEDERKSEYHDPPAADRGGAMY